MHEPRLFVWSVEETLGFDAAWVDLAADGLRADGEAVGQRPEPYSLAYHLETDTDWATRRLNVQCRTVGGVATLDLRRHSDGWTVDGTARSDLAGALDCDLAACALTNTMPIRRHDLHRIDGDVRFLMAFVEVPTLRVIPHEQRYTTIRRASAEGGAVVRYRSAGFQSDLEVDDAGVVVVYPKLGRRIVPGVNASTTG